MAESEQPAVHMVQCYDEITGVWYDANVLRVVTESETEVRFIGFPRKTSDCIVKTEHIRKPEVERLLPRNMSISRLESSRFLRDDSVRFRLFKDITKDDHMSAVVKNNDPFKAVIETEDGFMVLYEDLLPIAVAPMDVLEQEKSEVVKKRKTPAAPQVVKKSKTTAIPAKKTPGGKKKKEKARVLSVGQAGAASEKVAFDMFESPPKVKLSMQEIASVQEKANKWKTANCDSAMLCEMSKINHNFDVLNNRLYEIVCLFRNRQDMKEEFPTKLRREDGSDIGKIHVHVADIPDVYEKPKAARSLQPTTSRMSTLPNFNSDSETSNFQPRMSTLPNFNSDSETSNFQPRMSTLPNFNSDSETSNFQPRMSTLPNFNSETSSLQPPPSSMSTLADYTSDSTSGFTSDAVSDISELNYADTCLAQPKFHNFTPLPMSASFHNSFSTSACNPAVKYVPTDSSVNLGEASTFLEMTSPLRALNSGSSCSSGSIYSFSPPQDRSTHQSDLSVQSTQTEYLDRDKVMDCATKSKLCRKSFVSRLVPLVFNLDEVVDRNVNGRQGRESLDDEKVRYIKRKAFELFPADIKTTLVGIETMWKLCVSVIDKTNRQRVHLAKSMNLL